MLQRETFDNRRLSDSDIDEVGLVVDEMIRDGGAYGFPDTSDPWGQLGKCLVRKDRWPQWNFTTKKPEQPVVTGSKKPEQPVVTGSQPDVSMLQHLGAVKFKNLCSFALLERVRQPAIVLSEDAQQELQGAKEHWSLQIP